MSVVVAEYPITFTASLTPQTVQVPPGFTARAITVNNESNCWLYWASNQNALIAQPHQHNEVYQLNPEQIGPIFTLSATAPSADQPNQSAPVGSCTVVVTDADLAPTPGVIGTNVPVLINQILLGVVDVANVTKKLIVPPSVTTIMLAANAIIGTLSPTVKVVGATSVIPYYNRVLYSTDFCPVDAITDTAINVTINAGLPSVYVIGLGMPYPSTQSPLPAVGAYSDASGTITSGGVAQQLTPATPARTKLYIINTDETATGELLWFNFTTTAVQSHPSIPLKPGQAWAEDVSPISSDLISIIAATTGHTFVAKYMVQS